MDPVYDIDPVGFGMPCWWITSQGHRIASWYTGKKQWFEYTYEIITVDHKTSKLETYWVAGHKLCPRFPGEYNDKNL